MSLSVVILTKNEEGNIKDCIKSVRFADEVIVVDDFSKDETVKTAKKMGAGVYQRKLDSDFSAQRNFGLEKAKGEWVLFVDADERASKELAREIVQVINDPTLDQAGYYLRRYDYLWGRELKHGEIGAARFLRLAKRDRGTWARRVHEKWEVRGLTYLLKNPLLHYPHPTLSEFIGHLNNFSSLHAKANLEEGKRSSISKILIWPAGKFVYNWIVKLGFLDGLAGFIVTVIMSFSSFLAWSKLWFLQKKN